MDYLGMFQLVLMFIGVVLMGGWFIYAAYMCCTLAVVMLYGPWRREFLALYKKKDDDG